MLRDLETLPISSERIVVGDPHVFLELSYYARSPLRERIVHPLSVELDRQYRGSDSDALIISRLAPGAKLNVEDYDRVLAENGSFLLAAIPRDYLPWLLVTAEYGVIPFPCIFVSRTIQSREGGN